MPNFEYQIAPQDFSDWNGLHLLLHECYSFMEKRINPPSSLHQMTAKNLQQKAVNETLIIVKSDQKLIGCVFLNQTEKSLYVGKIAVDKNFRRAGIMSKLLSIAEALARKHNKASLELETRIELKEIHQAFAAFGFIKTSHGSHTGFSRPTFITMHKYL